MEYSFRQTGAVILFISLIVSLIAGKTLAFGIFFWINVGWIAICGISCLAHGNDQDLETGYKSLTLSIITLIIGLIFGL